MLFDTKFLPIKFWYIFSVFVLESWQMMSLLKLKLQKHYTQAPLYYAQWYFDTADT